MIVRPVFPRLRLRLVAALLIVYTAGYAASAQDATRDNFHFSKFTNLRQGDRFHIVGLTGYAAGSKIGEGRIARLNARELLLEFSIRTTLSGPVSGRVDLTHIGRRARKAVLRLRYSGATPSGPEKTDEQVLADPFLLTNVSLFGSTAPLPAFDRFAGAKQIDHHLGRIASRTHSVNRLRFSGQTRART